MNTFKSTYNDFKEQYDLTGDLTADNETWAAYVDGIVKSGGLTQLHWQRLPNLSEIETWEDEATDTSYLIDSLGIEMVFKQIDVRPDRMQSDWDKVSTHYHITIMRGDKSVQIYYSQGSAHTQLPSRDDVLYCLVTDYAFKDYILEDMDGLGYDLDDPEDRKLARNTLKLITKNCKKLEVIFSKQEIESLQVIYQDY